MTDPNKGGVYRHVETVTIEECQSCQRRREHREAMRHALFDVVVPTWRRFERSFVYLTMWVAATWGLIRATIYAGRPEGGSWSGPCVAIFTLWCISSLIALIPYGHWLLTGKKL